VLKRKLSVSNPCRQCDLLARKVISIDRSKTVIELATRKGVAEVQHRTARPQSLLGLGDLEGCARVAVKPLVLHDIPARRDAGHVDRGGTIDGSVPEVKGAGIVDGSLGGGEGGGDCEDEGGERGCGMHGEIGSLRLWSYNEDVSFLESD
jgi:hypothetical protein